MTYQNNAWKVVDIKYYTINDGNGHYLSANGTNTFSNTNASGATHFYFQNNNFDNPEIVNPNGTINYVYNGSIYYLNLSISNYAGTLQSITSNSSTSWSNDGNSIYYADGAYAYYLEYNNGWVIRMYGASYITDGTNYMTVSGTTIGNTTSVNSATLFIFGNTGNNPSGTIRPVGSTNYLRNNNGTLQISSTSTSWSNNGDNLHNNGYYLKCVEGSWKLGTDNAIDYYISKGSYYMVYSNSALTGSTNPTTSWLPSNGTFSSNPGNIKVSGSTNQYLTSNTSNPPTISVANSNWPISWTLNNGGLG